MSDSNVIVGGQWATAIVPQQQQQMSDITVVLVWRDVITYDVIAGTGAVEHAVKPRDVTQCDIIMVTSIAVVIREQSLSGRK